jgi:hypothetical protein
MSQYRIHSAWTGRLTQIYRAINALNYTHYLQAARQLISYNINIIEVSYDIVEYVIDRRRPSWLTCQALNQSIGTIVSPKRLALQREISRASVRSRNEIIKVHKLTSMLVTGSKATSKKQLN